MKSNKDVRATLCLGIYTTWRNKTYIVRGSQKVSLRPVEAKSYWIAGLFLLKPRLVTVSDCEQLQENNGNEISFVK